MDKKLHFGLSQSASWILAQYACSLDEDSTSTWDDLFNMIAGDEWLQGYCIGTLHATVQACSDIHNQAEELATAVVFYTKYLAMPQEISLTLLNTNKLNELQINTQFIEGMDAAAHEILRFFHVISSGSPNPADLPKALHTYLVSKRGESNVGAEGVDAFLLIEIMHVANKLYKQVSSSASKSRDIRVASGQGSQTGCLALILMLLSLFTIGLLLAFPLFYEFKRCLAIGI